MKTKLFFIIALVIFLPAFVSARVMLPSPYVVDASLNGGDCQIFGAWNSITKTCTLSQTPQNGIVIASDNTTLDGNGHEVSQWWDSEITVSGRNFVTIKNVTIRNAFDSLPAVLLKNSQNITLENVMFEGNAGPFDLSSDSNVIFSKDNFEGTFFFLAFNPASPPVFSHNHFNAYDTPDEGCLDANSDHFCDAPYVVFNGSVVVSDSFARTTPNVSDSALTPVLFIPGILGTELWKDNELLWMDVPRMFGDIQGDRFMDPLSYNSDGTPSDNSLAIGNVLDKPFDTVLRQFDYTHGFVSEMASHGYSVDASLFLFPYDWRADLSSSAVLLKNKIDTIIAQTGMGKIDIVAHSQGGLVLKKFLLDHPEYNSKIRKVVFLGTPNIGSPKAAKVLLQGDTFDVSFAGLGLDSSEVQRISQNMPAVYELLPSQEYFAHTSGYLGTLAINWFGSSVETIANYSETKQKLLDAGLNYYSQTVFEGE